MNKLDLEAVNYRSPYDVHCVDDQYVFVTDTGIEYHVVFELDSNPYYTAYWFNLANPEQQKSPGDKKELILLGDGQPTTGTLWDDAW